MSVLSFLLIHVVPIICDVVGVNTERWEVWIRNHRRGDVDHPVVVVVGLSFRREVAKVIDETVI